MGGAAHLVSDDQPSFTCPFDLENFNDGSMPALDLPDDLKRGKIEA